MSRMNGVNVLLLKKRIKFIYIHLFCCNHTGYCVGMGYVISASRDITSASRYQSRSSMCIGDLISPNCREFWRRQFQLLWPKSMALLFFETLFCGLCDKSIHKQAYSFNLWTHTKTLKSILNKTRPVCKQLFISELHAS